MDVNAHVGQQALGLRAIERRAFNRLGPVTDQQAVSHVELFARGVPAEVVVRFEDQNAGVSPGLLAEEMRRRKSAHPATHHDEIVGTIRRGGGARGLPKSSVTQPVRGFKRSRVVATHPALRRRIVAGAILRGIGTRIRTAEPSASSQGGTERQAADPDGDSVQKIAARNGAVHAQIVIVYTLHRSKLLYRLQAGAGCRFLVHFPYHPEGGPGAENIRVMGRIHQKLGCAAGKVEEAPVVERGQTGNFGIRPAVEPLPGRHGATGNAGILQLGFGRETIFLSRRLR